MKITVKCTFLPQADLQRSLAFEAESDPTIMDQEQTWPTAEELEQAQTEEHRRTKRVPKGTSEYQAAWIVSDEEDEADDEDGKGRVDDDQVCSLVPLSLSRHSHSPLKDSDEGQYAINANRTDDLQSVELNDRDEQEEEEEEEEMDELVINPNNYDEKLDLDEDKQAFVARCSLMDGSILFFSVQFREIQASQGR